MLVFRLVTKTSFDPQVKAIEASIDAGAKDGVTRVLDIAIDIAKEDFKAKRQAEGKEIRGPRIGEHKAFYDSFQKTPVSGKKGQWKQAMFNAAPNANIIDETGRTPFKPQMPYETARKIVAKEGKLKKKTETFTDESGKKRRRNVNEYFIVNRFRKAAAEKGQRPYHVMKATREQLKRAKAKREMTEAIKRRIRAKQI